MRTTRLHRIAAARSRTMAAGLGLLALIEAAEAQSTCVCDPVANTCTLQNPFATYVFKKDPATNEFWLERGYVTPSRPVTFLRTTSWQLQLRETPPGTQVVDVTSPCLLSDVGACPTATTQYQLQLRAGPNASAETCEASLIAT